MAANTIYIWQGFDHQWNYNHRMNRLGSFISDKKKLIYHTGASGTGRDELEFKDFYSKVKTESISSIPGEAKFLLKGQEGTISTTKTSITLDIEKSQRKHIVLLQGFDIYSNDDSDSLLILDIEIQNVNTDQNKLTFDIAAHLNVDCKTVECKPLNKEFDYTLHVYYQVLSCEVDSVQFSFLNISKNSYSWNTRSEIFRYNSGTKDNISFLKHDAFEYPHVTAGYKRIGIHINRRKREKAPHMLRLFVGLNNININSRFQYSIVETLFYKNWRKGMGWYKFPFRPSMFAFRRAGSFLGITEKIVIHMKDAYLKSNLESRGCIDWPGGNKPSNDPGGLSYSKLL